MPSRKKSNWYLVSATKYIVIEAHYSFSIIFFCATILWKSLLKINLLICCLSNNKIKSVKYYFLRLRTVVWGSVSGYSLISIVLNLDFLLVLIKFRNNLCFMLCLIIIFVFIVYNQASKPIWKSATIYSFARNTRNLILIWLKEAHQKWGRKLICLYLNLHV